MIGDDSHPGFAYPFIGALASVIERHDLPPSGATAVVAVSAGCDSMVLFHGLAHLCGRRAWRLIAAHFHHQLRGADADADQEFVRGAAARFDCPFVAGTGDVAREALPGESIEMAGRRLRHAFLAGTAVQHGAAYVFTGHHADDQVELFLMRLLRGAGGTGLGGMSFRDVSPADPRVALVRPLLEFDRSFIEASAREMGIEWRDDTSNRDPAFLRNRVRHELLPLLERRFQSGARRVLLREQCLLRDQAAVVDAAALAWLNADPARREGFTDLYAAIQREVLKRQLEEAKVSPAFDLIEALRAKEGIAIQVDAARSVVRNAAGELRVIPVRGSLVPFRTAELRVDFGASAGLAEFGGLKVDWRIEPGMGTPGAESPQARPMEEHLDADRIGPSLTLRHWRPGDRFQPIGLLRASKLQDLLTNAHIPSEQRRGLVIAEAPGLGILWVEGLRLGSPARLTSATRRRLVWCWRRVDQEG